MSKLESLVPPLELCKLIPAGEFGDSAFEWFSNYHFGGWHVEKRELAGALSDNGELYPAPTLEEIMEALPAETICGKEHHDDWFVSSWQNGCIDDTERKGVTTAALKLWLKLKGIEYAE